MGGSFDESYDPQDCWTPPGALEFAETDRKCSACRHVVQKGEHCAIFRRADYDEIDYNYDEDDEDRPSEEDCIHYTQCTRCFAVWTKMTELHTEAKTDHWVDPSLSCSYRWDEFFDFPIPEDIQELLFKKPKEVSP